MQNLEKIGKKARKAFETLKEVKARKNQKES